jgi:GMP synthase-like glutamine amidotransferase
VACQWHSWRFEVPGGGELLAESPVCPQAFRAGTVWGTQFHPEVDAATYARWIDHYDEDPSAVAMGFDPEAARAAAARHMTGWNEIGRRLFAAFLSASDHAP